MNVIKSFLYAYSKNKFLKVSLGILISIIISFGITTKSNDLGGNWRHQVNEENINYKESLESPYITPYIENEFTTNLKQNEAYLENDVNPDYNNAWEFFYTQLDLIFILLILIGIFLINYQDNERDILLIKNFKKMYFFRLLSYIFLYFYVLIVMLIICFILGALLWPNTIFNHEYFSIYNNTIVMSSFISNSLNKIILMSITCISYIIVLYILHSITNNSLTYLLVVIFYGGGFYLTSLVNNIDIKKYSYFINIDLYSFIEKNVNKINGLSLWSSTLKIAIYSILFIFLGYFLFIGKNKLIYSAKNKYDLFKT